MKAQRSYGWYKHHAWAALAMLSLFFAARQLVSVPDMVTAVVIAVLSIYAIGALVFTYLANKEPTQQQRGEDLEAKAEKEQEKLEKKRIKAELKAKKKERS